MTAPWPHPHHFLVPTLDPDFRRCSRLGCSATARVFVTRPALAVVGSTTSEAAARSTDRQRTRAIVWQAFLGALDGLTDEELTMATGLDPSTARPRRVELVQDNALMDSGERRPSRWARAMTVWARRI